MKSSTVKKKKRSTFVWKRLCRVGAPLKPHFEPKSSAPLGSITESNVDEAASGRKIPGGVWPAWPHADLPALLAYVGTNWTPRSVPKRAKVAPGLQLAAARSRPHRSRILQANLEYSFHTNIFSKSTKFAHFCNYFVVFSKLFFPFLCSIL